MSNNKKNRLFTIYASTALALIMREQSTHPNPRCRGCRATNKLFGNMSDAWHQAREQLLSEYPNQQWSLNSVTIFEDGSWEADYDLKPTESKAG